MSDLRQAATDVALDRLRRYADHPSGFLAYNSDVEHFVAPGVAGIVAYRRHGRYAYCLGGPFGAVADRPALLRSFRSWAERERLRVAAVQVRAADAALFAAEGFLVNAFGLSYSIDLERFRLAGKPLAKVRQNMSRARRDGVAVSELSGPAVVCKSAVALPLLKTVTAAQATTVTL